MNPPYQPQDLINPPVPDTRQYVFTAIKDGQEIGCSLMVPIPQLDAAVVDIDATYRQDGIARLVEAGVSAGDVRVEWRDFNMEAEVEAARKDGYDV